jgi:hypothetical protein
LRLFYNAHIAQENVVAIVVQEYHKMYSEAASLVAAGWPLTAFEDGRSPPA